MPALRTTPARQSSLREHNLALVLGQIADRALVSRARIAATTGLTKATVSSLVDSLVAAGLVDELGLDADAPVGRPGQTLGLSSAGPVGVGLELNVDYLATCTVDLTGAVRQREVVLADLRGVAVEDVLTRAANLVRRAVDGAQAMGADVAGLAVAVPGLVESDRQVLRLAPNLGWRDVAVLFALRRRTGLLDLPMRLDNEANLAALGELWHGGHKMPDGAQLDTFLQVSGEIGVGAGLVVGGRLFRGRHGFSGELGHIGVRGDGPVCGCGATGCLEQAAGQEAILRAAGVLARPTTTYDRVDGPIAELATRAAAGDEQAVAAIRAAGSALGVAMATAVNLMDVDTVVLGGIYAVLAPWLGEPFEAELSRRVLAAEWAPVRVLVSALGREAAVRGAAISVVRAVIADPAAYLARSLTL